MYIVVGTPHVYRVQVPPQFKGYERPKLHKNNHGGSAVEANNADLLGNSFLIGVTSNRERNLFLLWSNSTFFLWNCRPAVQLFAFARSPESLAEFGENVKVIWKQDSSSIAVTTDKSYILFFNIELEQSGSGFLSAWAGGSSQKRYGKLDEDFLPWTAVVALQMNHSFVVKTDGIVEDFCCIRDELLVALSTGAVQRISWSEGLVNFAFSFNINEVPFGLELQHFRGSILSPMAQHAIPKTFVKAIQYSSLLAGFVITLADGRAGFITSPTLRFEPNKLQAVWAREVHDATGCQTVNNCYRLLCFGLHSGRVALYCIGELTGSLDLVQRLEISPADCPDAHARCGPVSTMVWSPDERVLAVAWQKEAIAIYSVFGSLLFLSLTSLPSICSPFLALQRHNNALFQINSLEWSPEGYQLWIVPTDCRTNFVSISMAKSALTRNPCESNHLHVLLQSDDCLYVGLVDRLHSPLFSSSQNESQISHTGDSGPALALSVVPIAPGMAYLSDNWPISFSCISETGDWVAVSGRTGLACFSLKRRLWKLFGNISQERDFIVTGGLLLWRDFVVALCYNVGSKRDEIRFYPLSGRLDNTNLTTHRLETQALLLNSVQDMLILFGMDSLVTIFYLRKKNQTVERHKLVEINIGQFLAHPLTVTHITLTTLSTDIVLLMAANQISKNDVSSPPSKNSNAQSSNSLLVTTSGRVLLLQADRPISSQSSLNNAQTSVIFSTPVRIAEQVEHLWLMSCDPINNAALAETIWLYCGRNGANVWLPLVNSSNKNMYDARSQAFLSKRVMLQVDCPIYPLTALLSVAAVVGAASETTASAYLPFSPQISDKTSDNARITRFEAIRTSHSYLPSILRQLLRRHLGLQALEVTRSWSHLTNFPHVLELLLHQVVDEEAMSKEPLPDPLLPRVVAFIQQFPEHSPAVVVQCARKMEAILWPYLFATVGPPRDLFADCLRRQDLDTAVSYLIILHTTEQSSFISRQLTSELLTSVLEAKRWSLAQDILRFLRSIGSACLEPPPQVSLVSPRPSRSDSTGGSFPQTQSLQQTISGPVTPGGRDGGWSRAGSDVVSRSTPPPPTPHPSKDNLKEEVPVDIDLTERVVLPFLRKLVHERRLLDMGRLSAAIHGATRGFSLAAWLGNERLKSWETFRMVDFVGTLHRLHADFEWPYPILVHQVGSGAGANVFSAPHHSNSYSGRSVSQTNLIHQTPSQPTTNQSVEPLVKFRMAPPTDEYTQNAGYEIELVPKFTVGSRGLLNCAIFNTIPLISFEEVAEVGGMHHVLSYTSGDNNSDSGSIISHSESLQSFVSADGAIAVPPPNNVQVLQRASMLGQVYKNEQHLRFLFRVMIEASFYDWALLLSIILRDAKLGVESVRSIVALMSREDYKHSEINEARQCNSHNASNVDNALNPAIIATVRDICVGFGQFVQWASQACPGYLAFAHVMDPQIRRLSFLLAQSPPASPPRSRAESPQPIVVQSAPSKIGPTTPQFTVPALPANLTPQGVNPGRPVSADTVATDTSLNVGGSVQLFSNSPLGAHFINSNVPPASFGNHQTMQSSSPTPTSSSHNSQYSPGDGSYDGVGDSHSTLAFSAEDHLIAADQLLKEPSQQQSNCIIQ